MIRLDDGRCIIGFDDGYQLGKTANFVFDNGVHMLGSAEPTLKENSLFYDGEYFKVGEGRAAITEDKISDDSARLRTMAGINICNKSKYFLLFWVKKLLKCC